MAEKSGLSRSDVVDIPGTVSWWTVTLGLRANSHRPLIGSAVPYVHGSLAFVHMRGSTPPLLTQSPTFDPAEMALKQTTAGGVIGAGLEFDVGERVDFYLEARLAMGVGGETTMFMPVVAGIAIR